MIRFLLLTGALSTCLFGHSQGLSICHQVIGATGNATTESGLHYTYTVGEPVIFTLKKDGIDAVLTQGFHQPDVCLPVSTNNPEEWVNWEIQAYPNPVVDYLNIQYTAPNHETLHGIVVNAMGQQVMELPHIEQGGEQIQCNHLTAGFYVLVLSSPGKSATISIPFSKLF